MNARLETGFLAPTPSNEAKSPLFTRRKFISKSLNATAALGIAAFIPATYYSRKEENINNEITKVNKEALIFQTSPTVISGFDSKINDLENQKETAKEKTKLSIATIAILGVGSLFGKKIIKD